MNLIMSTFVLLKWLIFQNFLNQRAVCKRLLCPCSVVILFIWLKYCTILTWYLDAQKTASNGFSADIGTNKSLSILIDIFWVHFISRQYEIKSPRILYLTTKFVTITSFNGIVVRYKILGDFISYCREINGLRRCL